ncbi:MAG: DUF6958 family protein [Opitutales bacterium]
MPAPTPKILCTTPTPGKQPVRIDAWKYHLIKDRLVEVLRSKGPQTHKDLTQQIGRLLKNPEKDKLGSVAWYTTTVKLDLECKGMISRVNGSRPHQFKIGRFVTL